MTTQQPMTQKNTEKNTDNTTDAAPDVSRETLLMPGNSTPDMPENNTENTLSTNGLAALVGISKLYEYWQLGSGPTADIFILPTGSASAFTASGLPDNARWHSSRSDYDRWNRTLPRQSKNPIYTEKFLPPSITGSNMPNLNLDTLNNLNASPNAGNNARNNKPRPPNAS